MLWSKAVDIFESLESTKKKDEQSLILQEAFESLETFEKQVFVYVITGRVAPSFVKAETNLSNKILLKFVSNYLQRDYAEVELGYKKIGDIGSYLYSLNLRNVSSGYTIVDIYELVWKLVNITGNGSTTEKESVIIDVLGKMSSKEMKYLFRLFVGDMRLNVDEKSIVETISVMMWKDKKHKDILNNFLGRISDLGVFIEKVFKYRDNVEYYENEKIIVGRPISPRLVDRVASFEDALEYMTEYFYIQPKLDGLRAVVHYTNNVSYKDNSAIWSKYIDGKDIVKSNVSVFSRNLKSYTGMFPEIEEEVERICREEDIVLDGELIGVSEDGYMDFQKTSSRRRKYDIGDSQIDVPVKYFAFDILYYNGEDLLGWKLEDRVALLRKVMEKAASPHIKIVETVKINSSDDMVAKFYDYLESGYEGAVIKRSDSKYIPGVRNKEWLKLKKANDKGLLDELDLAVVGYDYAKGEKSNLVVGSLLVGIFDSNSGLFTPISKVGSGLTDELRKEIKASEEVINSSMFINNINPNLSADVFVKPQNLVVVRFEEFTRSSIYSICLDSEGKGVGLRFPRIIKYKRADKDVYHTTGETEIKSMLKRS